MLSFQGAMFSSKCIPGFVMLVTIVVFLDLRYLVPRAQCFSPTFKPWFLMLVVHSLFFVSNKGLEDSCRFFLVDACLSWQPCVVRARGQAVIYGVPRQLRSRSCATCLRATYAILIICNVCNLHWECDVGSISTLLWFDLMIIVSLT